MLTTVAFFNTLLNEILPLIGLQLPTKYFGWMVLGNVIAFRSFPNLMWNAIVNAQVEVEQNKLRKPCCYVFDEWVYH